MKHAIVNSEGIVVNVIDLKDGAEWSPPEGFAIVEADKAEIGWLHDGADFIAPVVPEQVKTTDQKRSDIYSNIIGLEAYHLMPRALRDIILKDPANAAYTKTKALDDQITALREQIKALG